MTPVLSSKLSNFFLILLDSSSYYNKRRFSRIEAAKNRVIFQSRITIYNSRTKKFPVNWNPNKPKTIIDVQTPGYNNSLDWLNLIF